MRFKWNEPAKACCGKQAINISWHLKLIRQLHMKFKALLLGSVTQIESIKHYVRQTKASVEVDTLSNSVNLLYLGYNQYYFAHIVSTLATGNSCSWRQYPSVCQKGRVFSSITTVQISKSGTDISAFQDQLCKSNSSWLMFSMMFFKIT